MHCTVQCSSAAVQCSAVQCSSALYSVKQCSVLCAIRAAPQYARAATRPVVTESATKSKLAQFTSGHRALGGGRQLP